MTQPTDVLDRNRDTESQAPAERLAGNPNQQKVAVAERVANAQPVNDAKTLEALEAAQGFAIESSQYQIPTANAPVAQPQPVAEPAVEVRETIPVNVPFEALATRGTALEQLRSNEVGRANARLN